MCRNKVNTPGPHPMPTREKAIVILTSIRASLRCVFSLRAPTKESQRTQAQYSGSLYSVVTDPGSM